MQGKLYTVVYVEAAAASVSQVEGTVAAESDSAAVSAPAPEREGNLEDGNIGVWAVLLVLHFMAHLCFVCSL